LKLQSKLASAVWWCL